MRLDKWLWAARFFKTRTLASRACELGRISFSGQHAKPSREVHTGDLLHIKNDSGDYEVEVRLLSEVRGPAPIAQGLYRETDSSRDLRLKAAEERRLAPHIETTREGKPTKRDLRDLNRLRRR